MSLEGQIGDQQMQKWMREEMDIVLYGRKKMNNEVDIGTLRSAQKTTNFFL